MSPAERDDLAGLEEEFKLLRTAYEKYFAGVERVEPLKDRDQVKVALRRMMTARTPNTATRYRLQTLQASLITYESYWNRVARQIEEGTYHRDVFRLERKMALEAPPKERAAAAPADASGADPKAAGAPLPPAPSTYPESLRRLHESFVRARAEVGDPRPITIEALAGTVRKQMQAIKEKFKCERVEFAVALKDGRVILKATPR